MAVKPLSEKTFTEQFTTLTIKDQLLSLPKEIWLHAASFLNKSEIKNLALASKAHLPLAKKALNDLEKTTALHELREINTLNTKQPAWLVSCVILCKQILDKLHKDHLIDMEPARKATLLQNFSALSTHEAANRLRKLNQTLADQIDTGQVYIDTIEISYAEAKTALVIEALLESVSVATNPEHARSAALKIAINANRFKIAKELVANGSITLAVRNEAVLLAAKNGHLEIVKALLADGGISEVYRGWAVKNAAENGHLAVVQTLLANGEISEKQKSRAVGYAAAKGHLEIVQALLENGAISEGDRDLAVENAAQNGHLQIVHALLATWKINMKAKGLSVVKAAENGHLEVVHALLACGEISKMSRGWAVKEAANNGHLSVIQALLASGEISQDDRSWAVIYAAKNGHLEIQQVLLGNRVISEND